MIELNINTNLILGSVLGYMDHRDVISIMLTTSHIRRTVIDILPHVIHAKIMSGNRSFDVIVYRTYDVIPKAIQHAYKISPMGAGKLYHTPISQLYKGQDARHVIDFMYNASMFDTLPSHNDPSIYNHECPYLYVCFEIYRLIYLQSDNASLKDRMSAFLSFIGDNRLQSTQFGKIYSIMLQPEQYAMRIARQAFHGDDVAICNSYFGRFCVASMVMGSQISMNDPFIEEYVHHSLDYVRFDADMIDYNNVLLSHYVKYLTANGPIICLYNAYIRLESLISNSPIRTNVSDDVINNNLGCQRYLIDLYDCKYSTVDEKRRVTLDDMCYNMISMQIDYLSYHSHSACNNVTILCIYNLISDVNVRISLAKAIIKRTNTYGNRMCHGFLLTAFYRDIYSSSRPHRKRRLSFSSYDSVQHIC